MVKDGTRAKDYRRFDRDATNVVPDLYPVVQDAPAIWDWRVVGIFVLLGLAALILF